MGAKKLRASGGYRNACSQILFYKRFAQGKQEKQVVLALIYDICFYVGLFFSQISVFTVPLKVHRCWPKK